LENAVGNEKRIKELYEKAHRNPASLKFSEACTLAEGVGFRLDRVHGSHNIFVHSNPKCLLNVQEVRRQAKAYQVRQLLKMIDEFKLLP
jgi:predicted RNA binding protein YcfA (HicA-like mRNA interferase family)